MKIEAVDIAGAHRSGGLKNTVTPAQIKKVLGFAANIDDDKSKVKHSWGFIVDGVVCGIWDYKGARWSIYGDREIFEKLFPDQVE